MNRDDIIRMAREAGLVHRDDKTQSDAFLFAMPDRIERFAALVAAHEREKQVDKYHAMKAEMETYKRLYEERGKALARPCIECGHVPAAIRARGEA